MSEYRQAPPLPRAPTVIREAHELSVRSPPRSPAESSISPPKAVLTPKAASPIHRTTASSPEKQKHAQISSAAPSTAPITFPKFEISASRPSSIPPSTEKPKPTPTFPNELPPRMLVPSKLPNITDRPDWTSAKTAPEPTAIQPMSSAFTENATESPKPNSSPSQQLLQVAWNRASSDTLESSLVQPTAQPEKDEEVKGLLAKITALFKRKAETRVVVKPPTKPPLQKAKDIVCKLPDPTLIFLIEVSVILLLHSVVPHILRSWTSRIIVPILLIPTVAATALWRRTTVTAKPGRTILSIAKPIPNAEKVVIIGVKLRARENAVIAAEDKLRDGRVKLELMRKVIEARLPPQDSITSLLESDKKAREES